MRVIADLGAVAQLVAHLHGMQGVRGSNPLSSTFDPCVCREFFLRVFPKPPKLAQLTVYSPL